MDLPHTQPMPCPRCGTVNGEDRFSCRLCSEMLRKRPAEVPHESLFAPGTTTRSPVPEARPHMVVAENGAGGMSITTEGYAYAGIGLALATVIHFVPILGFFNWFLSALFHETGHCVFAWAMGQPAFPAISLGGHAAAVHQGQSLFLTLAICAGLGFAAWKTRGHRGRFICLTTLAILQPMLAFSGAKDVLFLLGGHLGELAFGAIFLWRAFTGGFTANKLERVLYGTLACHLIGENVMLCGGLLFSQAARLEYAGNGSFGLTNDFLRLANDQLGVSLGTVAFGMLVVSLLTIPVACWMGHRSLTRAGY